LYISTTPSAVSRALVVKKEVMHKDKTAKQQFPVYFVSEVLTESKKFYCEMEKICRAVIMNARKLRHYFKAHTVKVLTNQPLGDIFGNRDSSERINKWAMELSEYVVDLEKHSAIKSQVLANFVTEWTEPGSRTEGELPESPWLVYCNGAWGAVGAGVAAILISSSEIKLRYTARLQFSSEADKCTNNIAEYKAILLSLRKLRAIGVYRCTLHTHSKVVVGQIEKECISRDPALERYLALVRRMDNYFKGFTVEYIERTKNAEANELVKATACNSLVPANIFFQVLEDASIKTVLPKPKIINIIEVEDWRAVIMAYLCHYYKPDSKNEQIRMQLRVKDYQIVSDELYKTFVSGPLLRFLSKIEGK
jgi:ribonuclease HI